MGLDQNNLPYSTAHPEPAGFEYEIAGLLAKELGVRLRVYWAYSSHDSYPSKLSKGLCDVLLGVTPDDRFVQRVQFSRPYYVASYQVVVRTVEVLSRIRSRLGVEEGLALRGLKGRAVKTFPSTEAILKAVAEGRITCRLCDFNPGIMAGLRANGQASLFSFPVRKSWIVFRSVQRCASRMGTSRTQSTVPGTRSIDRGSLRRSSRAGMFPTSRQQLSIRKRD